MKLPLFNGFYGSIFDDTFTDALHHEITSLADCYCLERDIVEQIISDRYTEDYQGYCIAICKKFTDVINDVMGEIEILKDVSFEFDDLISPKEYNFYNDVICVKANFPDNFQSTLKAFMVENKEYFERAICEYFTPSSGWWPYYPAYFSDWMGEDLEDIQISWLIEKVILMYQKDENDFIAYLECKAFEDVYMEEFIEISENAILELEKLK